MCKGTICPLRTTCYRFTANKNDLQQSYFMNVPYDHVRMKCDEYWCTIN